MATVLITGIQGGLAHTVARQLLDAGHEVVGVDYRQTPPLPPPLDGMRVYRANYNKTAIEDIFRHHAFDRVLHLGRVGNLKESMGKRFDLNVVGSQKIMNLCRQHGVKRLIVLSTFHIYGAHPANHTPISEDDPLRAGTQFPQIADAIQLDNMASRWVYENDGVSVVVVRPTNVVGPHIHNAMSNFLRGETVPHLAGFNPMTQFVHEDDIARAVVMASESTARGIFNVAGAGEVPWCTALAIAKAHTFPFPEPLAALAMRLFSAQPAYLINFFKYPCVITDEAFRKAFGWRPEISIEETIWSTVAEVRQQQAARRGIAL